METKSKKLRKEKPQAKSANSTCGFVVVGMDCKYSMDVTLLFPKSERQTTSH